MEFAKLNFPPVELRRRRCGGVEQVWDPLRRMWLKLTPEEWVRRHLLAYLVTGCGVHPLRIVQEYAVPLNGQAQRADVVVVGDRAEPLLLAECKAPGVAIRQTVLDQAVRYNSVLQARYIVLTNGLDHYCYEFADAEYRPMSGFPQLSPSL